ncbi:MAG: hypothetical protein KGH69_01875 [Candidatus Micrarchaeota archaeon]|nr:hypothetical protein [Candidatus Micrarchaeota archaeon]
MALRTALLAIALVSVLSGAANAGYWFQYGIRGGYQSSFNNGVSASIQTIAQPQLDRGSSAFWIGESLSNGAFIQMGYLTENQTALYPLHCNLNGCGDYKMLKKGVPTWFYEYFPAGYNGGFLGEVGENGSAGINGTFNTYDFHSNGTTWYFMLNGNVVGSVDLGTGTSGQNDSIAFGEVANTTNNQEQVNPVIFANVSIYKDGSKVLMPFGYSYIGYGVGSSTALPNPYGLKELDSRVNYFAVGSGLPQPDNGKTLWTTGYTLSLMSKYGNLSRSTLYESGVPVTLSIPSIFYIDNYTRVLFSGWSGKGIGAYSGSSNRTQITLYSNVTEQANWQTQYLANVSSIHAIAAGSGWYAASSVVNYSVSSSIVYSNSSSRFSFLRWSNGNPSVDGSFVINAPANVVAQWQQQFLVSATSDYGNVSGSGWYANGSIATLSVKTPMVNVSPTERLAFYSWSNGNTSSAIKFAVNNPLGINADYKSQYLVNFSGTDAYGNPIALQSLVLGNSTIPSSSFVFGNVSYMVRSVMYNGVSITVDRTTSISSSGTKRIVLPIYNVMIVTKDIFGRPVEAHYDLRFTNGTEVNGTSNSDGTISFSDVPYGSAVGTIEYLGIKQSVSVSNGTVDVVPFVSLLDIAIMMAAVAAAFLIYNHARKRLSGPPIRKEDSQDYNSSA